MTLRLEKIGQMNVPSSEPSTLNVKKFEIEVDQAGSDLLWRADKVPVSNKKNFIAHVHGRRDAILAQLQQMKKNATSPDVLERYVKEQLIDLKSSSERYFTANTKYAEGKQKTFQLLDDSEKELHFPSQKALTACLVKHPLTSDYTHEKKINETAAKAFANSTKVPLGVELGVMFTMEDLNQKLRLSESTLRMMGMNLTQALTDCAKENQTAPSS